MSKNLLVVAHLVAVVGVTAQFAAPVIGEKTRSEEVHEVFDSKFVRIAPGTFTMGSRAGERNERPVHTVTISHHFELLETEVTQAQWKDIQGSDPSHFRGANRPVETVSWHDVQDFLSALNARDHSYRYRLPTEAEWEYACRAGTTAEFAGDLDAMGYYDKNSGLSTHPVRGKQPNAWGVYDMHGNVWEWAHDWYGKYPRQHILNPTGPLKGSLRVVRGGGWHSTADASRPAFRLGAEPGFRNSALGFRVVRVRQP